MMRPQRRGTRTLRKERVCLALALCAAVALGFGASDCWGYWLRHGRGHTYAARMQQAQAPADSSTTQSLAGTLDWTAQPFQTELDQATCDKAMAWAAHPDSFCFQGPNAHHVNLTIVSASSPDIPSIPLTCIRKNRLLMALEQNARYCHFMSSLDPSRAPHWSKILAIKQALQLSPFVLWMDLDSLFLRFETSVHAAFLKLLGDKDVLFSAAKPGQFGMPREWKLSRADGDQFVESHQTDIPLNTGVLFLRSSSWTQHFLDSVYVEAPYTAYWGLWGFYDQSGFMHFMRRHRQEWAKHARVVPFRLINGLEKDSLLYHVAGGARNASKYGRMVFKCQQANCDRSGLGKCARLAGVSGG